MWALALLGCPVDDPPPEACVSPSWDAFAEGYVRTWCTACHTASLTGEARQGAPAGVDFDRWSEVHAWRDAITRRATGGSPDMPPLGGPHPDDVARFGEWLGCGAQGADPPPGACDDTTSGPPAVVGSQADADRLCATGNRVAALTVTGSATLPCLCGIDGALVVSGGDLVLPSVSDVGAVTVEGGSLVAPALDRVASLRVTGEVTTLAVPALRTVTGDVVLTDLTALADASFDGLLEVGGSWTVARSPSLVTIDLPRLRTVGGSFLQEDLSALTALAGTRALERIGGALVLHRMPRLVVLDDWAFLLLAELGGDLIVEDNAALVGIHGFTTLPDVPGNVVIERNPSLVRVDGFDLVVHVGGDVRIRGNVHQQHVLGFVNLEHVDGGLVFEDLPQLRSMIGFGELVDVGALRFTRIGPAALVDFGSLQTVATDLVLAESPRITRIDGLDTLTMVGGDLRLLDNAVLETIDGWAGIAVIGGSLEARDNPVLPTSRLEQWVGTIEVGGSVTIEGNGPG